MAHIALDNNAVREQTMKVSLSKKEQASRVVVRTVSLTHRMAVLAVRRQVMNGKADEARHASSFALIRRRDITAATNER